MWGRPTMGILPHTMTGKIWEAIVQVTAQKHKFTKKLRFNYTTTVLLPGKPHGWRSLVGYSPGGREESDVTKRLHFRFSLSLIGEGNGSPLQCSFLENPRDGGAWWASVYGVAQSQTRLKWLSSSSMVPVGLWAQKSSLQPMYWGIGHWGLTMKWIFQ